MDSTSTPLLTGGNRRSRRDIIATIITVARNGESRAKIMEKAHLNSQQLKLYLEELAKLGLIEVNKVNGRRVYTASQRGIQYLKQHNTLRKLLK